MKRSRPNASDSGPGGFTFNPLQILREAVVAVPAMRYAVGVLGLVAIVAIVSAWKLDFKVAIFGSIIILGLMVILALFAKVIMAPRAKGNRDTLYYASVFFVCVFGLLVTLAAVFLLTASAFEWPKPFADRLFPNGGAPPQDLAHKLEKLT